MPGPCRCSLRPTACRGSPEPLSPGTARSDAARQRGGCCPDRFSDPGVNHPATLPVESAGRCGAVRWPRCPLETGDGWWPRLFQGAAAARKRWIPMTPRRSNPGLWLSFGMSLCSVGRPQGNRLHRCDGLNRGALRPLAAGPRSRLALAAALVVASLLSPGASGACAGCCDDGSPTVAAPLAAGIAPVHAAAVVDAAPHRCCHRPDADAECGCDCCEAGASKAEGCCTVSAGADREPQAEQAGCCGSGCCK